VGGFSGAIDAFERDPGCGAGHGGVLEGHIGNNTDGAAAPMIRSLYTVPFDRGRCAVFPRLRSQCLLEAVRNLQSG
jgi:hypothetical protein